jgi:hypothetical protein
MTEERQLDLGTSSTRVCHSCFHYIHSTKPVRILRYFSDILGARRDSNEEWLSTVREEGPGFQRDRPLELFNEYWTSTEHGITVPGRS